MNDAPGRGIFSHDGRCWAVGGDTLYEVNSDGTVTSRGTVALNSNPVTWDTNGDAGGELILSSGDAAYVLNLSTNVLTNPLASGSTQVGQVDGFFVSLNAATSTFRISDSLDGTTWNALMIAQRTSASDPWIGMIIANQEIYLFGDKTGDVWYNAGLPTFPFAERPEGSFGVGIKATFSLARAAGTVAWLGRTERGGIKVYVMDGYTPTPISTTALEWLLAQENERVGLEDAIGWSYDREGHEFYILTLPAAGKTYAYDFLTRKWHRRGFWDQDMADFTVYRPTFHASCFDRNLVCDSNSANIYALSSTTYTDVGGSELRRMRVLPHLTDENKKLFFASAELECDRGVGNANAPGDDPVVVLEASNDGGDTYGMSRTRKVGKRGKKKTRVRWNQCGSARDRVWKLWTSDPNPSRWFDFYVNAKPGLH
jgi:hypothetical protein